MGGTGLPGRRLQVVSVMFGGRGLGVGGGGGGFLFQEKGRVLDC